MSVLEEIMKYSSKHARVVILILLGVITSGSIAGGLWIQNLNSIIAEKDKILEQRIQLNEKAANIGLASRSLSQRELNLQILAILNKLELSVHTSTNELNGLAKELRIIADSSKTTSRAQQLTSYSKTLINQSANISKELELAKMEIRDHIMRDSFSSENDYKMVRANAPNSLLLPVILLLLLILLAMINLYLLRRNQSLKQKS